MFTDIWKICLGQYLSHLMGWVEYRKSEFKILGTIFSKTHVFFIENIILSSEFTLYTD